MANKGYMILADVYNKVEVDKDNYNDVLEQIRVLASRPSPDNLWELAELVAYTTSTILGQRLNYLETIADMKNGAEGDKPEFVVKEDGIVAKIAARSSSPEISMTSERKVVLPIVEVQARPKIKYQDLVTKPEKIMDTIEETVDKMENAMLQHIEGVNYTAIAALGSPNYASGAGVVKATFDDLLRTQMRFGGAVIAGDYTMVEQLTELTGFSNRVAEKYMVEHNENGFIGIYKGADVLNLVNRYADSYSLGESNLVLRDDLLYVIATPADTDSRPLKVFVGGDVRVMERKNIEDESFEMTMRMDFATALVGNQIKMSVYEDTNE